MILTIENKHLSHGIHDHNHGLAYIINAVDIIKRLKENNNLSDGDFDKYLQLIIDGKNKCRESMDYIYNHTDKLG